MVEPGRREASCGMTMKQCRVVDLGQEVEKIFKGSSSCLPLGYVWKVLVRGRRGVLEGEGGTVVDSEGASNAFARDTAATDSICRRHQLITSSPIPHPLFFYLPAAPSNQTARRPAACIPSPFPSPSIILATLVHSCSCQSLPHHHQLVPHHLPSFCCGPGLYSHPHTAQQSTSPPF